ncbi:hypothetical protein Tco_0093735 [Tanacetum coccineum]
MTRSSTKELLSPFENPERVLRSKRKLFETPSLTESSSPEFDQISKNEEHIEEEEVKEIMAETMEQYMSKTRDEIRSGVARPTIDADIQFEIKGQFLKELRDNTFSGSRHEDANEHIKKVLEIVDLFHVPRITQDQHMPRAFLVSLTGAASCLGEPKPTRMSLELADRSIQYPRGIAEKVLIKFDKFILLINFVILDMREDSKIPIILGRPFLATARAMIDVFNKKITLRIGNEERIEQKDTAYSLSMKMYASGKTRNEHLCSTSANEIDEKKPELKDLPSRLKYAYLKGDKTHPIIISSKLTKKEKVSLLQAKIWKKCASFGIKCGALEELMRWSFNVLTGSAAHLQISAVVLVSECRFLPNFDRSRRSRKNSVHMSLWNFCLPKDAIWIVQCSCEFSKMYDCDIPRHGGRLYGSFFGRFLGVRIKREQKEEINNIQQEPDESLFRAWERFKELLMKCPQHYLTNMQEVILFYNGLDVPTRQILNLRGAIPTKKNSDAKVAIQEMAEYSQKWHNGTSSRSRSTETSDGLAAIQAQLNNLGREIKKVNEKVYDAQVGCEQCKGPHYTKDYPQKEEGKTLEAYYTQFGAPHQPGGQYRAAGPGFYQ